MARMARFLRVLLAGALLCSFGAPVAFIQALAWARMAMRFSRTAGFAQSLRMTFDGRHACSMCVRVQKASKDSRTLGPASSSRSKGALSAIFFAPPAGSALSLVAAAPSRAPGRAVSPRTPPPKAFAV